MIDLDAYTHGSVVSLFARTQAGAAWLAKHVEPRAIGELLLADHRCAPDIMRGAYRDGLEVAVDGYRANAPREGI